MTLPHLIGGVFLYYRIHKLGYKLEYIDLKHYEKYLTYIS